MWNYNYPDELYHYGRKGMRWYQHIFGKANNVSVSGSKRNAKKEEKEEAKAAAKAQKKRLADIEKENNARLKTDPRKMTDEELNNNINRLRNEQAYKDLLVGENVSRGKRAVSEALTNGSKTALQNITQVAATYAGKKAIKSLLGEETYNEMFGLKQEATSSSRLMKDLQTGKKKMSDFTDKEIDAMSSRMAKEASIRKGLGDDKKKESTSTEQKTETRSKTTSQSNQQSEHGKEKDEPLRGTVDGSGTSSNNRKESYSNSSHRETVDTFFREDSVRSGQEFVNRYLTSGQQFLLEDKQHK